MLVSSDQSTIYLIILVVSILALLITKKLIKSSFPYVFVGIIGLILGLLVGALLSYPLSLLPGIYGKWLPMVVNIFATVAVLDLVMAQTKNFTKLFKSVAVGETEFGGVNFNLLPEILLDTSVLIDGRIVALGETGFLALPLAAPSFVVTELQRLADSRDPLKKEKGKHGLEVLEMMKNSSRVSFKIINGDKAGNDGVDHDIIALARETRSRILTADVVLSRSATIQGVIVLNLADLERALKPMVNPGDNFKISVIQKGKEKGQGIGYLSDGSMVVVNDGDRRVGSEVDCLVTKIFPTLNGRIIFVDIV